MVIGQCPSITMFGIKDETRKIAQDILSLLALKHGDHLKTSKTSEFPKVDADELFPGIFLEIGKKDLF